MDLVVRCTPFKLRLDRQTLLSSSSSYSTHTKCAGVRPFGLPGIICLTKDLWTSSGLSKIKTVFFIFVSGATLATTGES